MQPLTLDRRDTGQQCLADELMAEHELAGGLAGGNKPGSLRFVEGIDQHIGVSIRHLTHELSGEYPARYGGGGQHLLGGLGQAV